MNSEAGLVVILMAVLERESVFIADLIIPRYPATFKRKLKLTQCLFQRMVDRCASCTERGFSCSAKLFSANQLPYRLKRLGSQIQPPELTEITEAFVSFPPNNE